MASTYKFLSGGTIQRTDDDGSVWIIPNEPKNADYARWQHDGGAGITAPADPPPLVYSGSIEVNARVRTTDATPTEILRRPLAQLTGYWADLRLLGVDAGNGAVRAIHAEIVVKRLNGGAVTVGAPVVVADVADAAATSWAISRSVSGNDVVITVTGAAGRTIDWQLSGHVRSFTPAGA